MDKRCRTVVYLLWAFFLLVIGAQEDYGDGNLTTSDEMQLVTTTRHPMWFDEQHYRSLVNSVGQECYAKADKLYLKLSTYEKSCLCLLYCVHRTVTPEELQQRARILASLQQTVKTVRLQNKWPYMMAYLVLSVVGMTGNVVILLAVTLCIARPSVINVMITSLAIADFFVVAFCAPFQTYAAGFSTWVLGEGMCKVMWYIYFACFCVSVFTMVVMAFERYLVICHPMKAQIWSSIGRARKTAAAVWFLAGVAAIPAAFTYGQSSGTATCGILWRDNKVIYLVAYLAVAIFGIPAIIMSVAYIRIGVTLYKSIAVRRKLKHSDGKESEGTDDRIQVIRLLMSMLLLFIICWGPSLILTVVWLAQENQMLFGVNNFDESKSVMQGLTILSYGNSTLNPFLYMLTSKQYRGAVVILLRACRTRKLPDKRQLGSTVVTADTSLASTQRKSTTRV